MILRHLMVAIGIALALLFFVSMFRP